MSRLIQILNAIKKAEATLELTPSQQAAYQAVSSALQRYGQCNLHGTVTCGKTFLGWRTAREHGSMYMTSPSLLASTPLKPQGIVIDNGSESRSDYRRILAMAQVRKHQPLLYISRLPVEEDMPQVVLCLTPDDLDAIVNNLCKMDIDVPADAPTDFWDVIVMAAGGSR